MSNKKSSFRDKLRSNALKELAMDRGLKRTRDERDKDDYSEDQDGEQRPIDIDSIKSKCKTNNSLLSILPKPKNASSFGPTLMIDKLLEIQERAEDKQNAKALEDCHKTESESKDGAARLTDDGMLEINVSKIVGNEMNTDAIKDLTIERAKPVILARGKEKQKNQITYLAQLGKANELERKEQTAQSRLNKAAARSKYGW